MKALKLAILALVLTGLSSCSRMPDPLDHNLLGIMISPRDVNMMLNGEQTFTTMGGTPPYTYSLTTGAGTIDPATGYYQNNLGAAPDTVAIRVEDAAGNSDETTITVETYGDSIINSPGIEALWRLESALVNNDETGNYPIAGNDIYGTISPDAAGPIAAAQDPLNEAAAFDGSLACITITNSRFNPVAADFTIMAWIKPANLNGTEPMAAFSQADPTVGRESAFIAVRTDTTDTIGCWYYDTVAGGRVWIDSGVYATIGQWYHAALVKSGTTASLYVNGVLTKTATMNLGSTTGDMAIGGKIDSGPSVTQLFNGSIDEVIIYTRALSSEQIIQYFQGTQFSLIILSPRTTTMAPGGQQVFTVTGGSPPYTFGMAGSGTISPGIVPGTAIYRNATVGPPETITIGVTDDLGRTDQTTINVISYPQTIQNVSGLMGYWPLETGSIPADKNANYSDGTIIGSITSTAGAIAVIVDPTSMAGVFDGASGIVIDNAPPAPPVTVFAPTGDFTAEAWFRVNEVEALATSIPVPDARVVFSLADSAGANDIAFIAINSTATDTIGCLIGGSWHDTGVQVFKDLWYHVMVTKSGADLQIYVNGSPRFTTPHAVTVPASVYDRLAIGAKITDNVPTLVNYFFGDIDDVALYNRALSADEAAARYLNSRGLRVGISPAVMLIPYLGTKQFLGFGGTGPYTYSVVPTGPTDGSVNLTTGMYTAPDYVAAAFEIDVIRVTDADGYTADAQIISAFLPNQLGGLLQWLNAEFIPGKADGDNVDFWPDASGLGNYADQTLVPAEQPFYHTNVLNGKPALYFNGSNSMYAKPGFSDLFNGNDSPYTFIIVFLTNTPASSQCLYGLGDDTTMHIRPGRITGGRYGIDRRSGANPSVTSATGITAGVWNFAAQRFWQSTTGVTSVYFNDATHPAFLPEPDPPGLVSFETAPFSFSSNDVRIGARAYNSDQYLDGYIAEIIIYDRDLDETTELERIREYLRFKYNLWP